MSTTLAIPATKIVELSNHVIRLNQLLAWDLATLRQHGNNSFYAVRLSMLDPKNTTLFLSTADLEDLVGTLVAKELSTLEEAGIDTTELIASFKLLGEQALGKQQNETPLDKPE